MVLLKYTNNWVFWIKQYTFPAIFSMLAGGLGRDAQAVVGLDLALLVPPPGLTTTRTATDRGTGCRFILHVRHTHRRGYTIARRRRCTQSCSCYCPCTRRGSARLRPRQQSDVGGSKNAMNNSVFINTIINSIFTRCQIPTLIFGCIVTDPLNPPLNPARPAPPRLPRPSNHR